MIPDNAAAGSAPSPYPPAFKPARRSSRAVFLVLGLVLLATVAACYYAVNVMFVKPSVAAAPLPAVAPVDPLLPRLNQISDRLENVDQQIRTLVDGQRQISSELGAVKAKLDKPAPVIAATVTPPHRTVRRVTRVAPAAPPETTQLLSVDTWDNKPSIVLRDAAGHVQFAQDGETTEQGRYVAARDGTQSVRIERRDGTSAVLRAVGDR